jgi:hypothetical protein
MSVNLRRIGIVAAAMLLAVAVLSAVVSFGASRTAQAASPPTLQFGCEYLKREAIDPIEDPAVPHVHEFYGNRSVNADSTSTSLKAHPATTCRIDESTSSYWHPAFREGGKVQTPQMIRNYYRDLNDINPNMRPIPDGLQNIATEANGHVRYRCGSGSPSTTPPVGCTQSWMVMFVFPNCWNPNAGLGPNSVKFSASSCPSTHPYQFPDHRMVVEYPRPADGTLSAPVEVSMGGGEWGPASQFAHADRMDGDPDAFNTKWLGPCVLNTTSSPSFCKEARS